MGASRLATGHYARIAHDPATGAPQLRAARDGSKDQSYFLFGLSAAMLARSLFPVGTLLKAEVRAEAARLGLPVADKPESMEVCFVPRGDTARFLEERVPAAALRPGSIVDEGGNLLGRHRGIHRFTVGQRRGIGVATTDGAPRYVRALDASTGTVRVARRERLCSRGLVARDVSWVTGTAPAAGRRVSVRIRHRHPLIPCVLTPGPASEAHVHFAEHGPAVTPGQAAVFYEGDLVLGGGWIAHELD
jgi:tRNA-specific 2-thiouridylase